MEGLGSSSLAFAACSFVRVVLPIWLVVVVLLCS